MILTHPQVRLLIASDPDDLSGEEGVGVELIGGAAYQAARALERKGLGHVEGPGGFVNGMYWSNAAGLEQRGILVRS